MASQPRPGPSPTPTPVPVGMIEIGDIIAQEEGALLVPASEWIPSFAVDAEYMTTCQPAVGGFFCVFPDVTCFMTAAEVGEKFPKN